MARTKSFFGGQISNRECPKALGVYNPSDLVSLLPWCFNVYASIRPRCSF
jgi:hypothetical protein